MTRNSLLQTLAVLAEPLAQSLGLSLWGVEVILAGRSTVRIFVESGDGVTIDQCAELSRLFGLALDVEDILPGAYTLEVSSPGLERVFFTAGQLAGAVGRTVEITLLRPLSEFPGRRRFRGILETVPECSDVASPKDRFGLRAEDTASSGAEAPLVLFAFADLKKATLVHIPPEKTLPGKGGKKSPAKKKPSVQKTEQDGDESEDAKKKADGSPVGEDGV
jgi:ribosome maturation factor RimP